MNTASHSVRDQSSHAGGRFQWRVTTLGVTRILLYAFFGFFLILPLIAMVLTALTSELFSLLGMLTSWSEFRESIALLREHATLDYLFEIFREPRYYRATVNSLVLSLAVALASVALTLPIAYAFARTAMPGKWLIGSLLLIPLIMPTFIAAYGMTLMFGRVGWVSQLLGMIGVGQILDLRSPVAVFLVQLYIFLPFALLPMIASFKLMDRTLEEAAAMAGAGRMLTWLTVTVPLAAPGMIAGGLLVFVVTLSDFGAPLILSPRQFPLLPMEAYREMTSYFQWAGAATLALVLAIIAVFVLLLQKMATRGGRQYELESKAHRPETTDRRVTLPLFVYSLVFLLFPLGILLSIIIQSFATTWSLTILPQGYTLENYQHVFGTSFSAVRNSFVLGMAALIVAMVVGTGSAYLSVRHDSKTLDLISYMPLAIPGVALGVAYIQSYHLPPAQLTGTAFLLIVAYAVRRLPHMVRTTSAAIQQVRGDLEEAGRTSGAPPGMLMATIVSPLIVPGMIAGGMLVFITVLKEISVTVLLAPSDWAPMSLEVFRYIVRGEYYAGASMAVMIILVVTVIQLLAQRLAGKRALF